jgi:hypothetical protein
MERCTVDVKRKGMCQRAENMEVSKKLNEISKTYARMMKCVI